MDNEYVVTIQLQVVVEDESVLLRAAQERRHMPSDPGVGAALSMLVVPPALADVPGVRFAHGTWTARVDSVRASHDR